MVSLPLKSNLSRWTLSVSVCAGLKEELQSWALTTFRVGLGLGYEAITETLQGFPVIRQWGDIESAWKRWCITVASPQLTGSSSGLQSKTEMDVRESWDGWVPAGVTAMNQGISGQQQQEINAVLTLRVMVSVWAWGCVLQHVSAICFELRTRQRVKSDKTKRQD